MCATTLILCPLSVMGNWIKQIKVRVPSAFVYRVRKKARLTMLLRTL